MSYVDHKAEALSWWGIGNSAAASLSRGAALRDLAHLAKVSLRELQEAVEVAKVYSTERDFVAAYDSHEVDTPGIEKSWRTFVATQGFTSVTVGDLNETVDRAKKTIREAVHIAQSMVDRTAAINGLGALRSFVLSRVPAVAGMIDDISWFSFAKCVYCGDDTAPAEVREVAGFHAPICRGCVDDAVATESINWRVVAENYNAYALECLHAVESIRYR